jgi:hypothetical protein
MRFAPGAARIALRTGRLAAILSAAVLCAAILSAALLAGCGEPDRASLPDRLQGNWSCLRTVAQDGFLRTDQATLELYRTSIKYAYDSHWVCDTLANDAKGISRAACEASAPSGLWGYFEGVFTASGDSLQVRDGTDTLAFRNVTDRTFEFDVNGLTYPMTRN